MDLHQLRVFQAVATAGGFTRASEHLHLSQSTVSLHIKQLEEEFGCPLFLRVGKRVFVTEAGQVLLQYADKIFREVRNAEMSVREMSSLQRGTVRLGVSATTLIYRLPHLLVQYGDRFPNIELIVITATTESLLESVRTHALDLAIVVNPPPEQGLTITPVGAEELVIAINADHPLARKRTLDPGDLTALRFILYEKSSAMQSLIDAFFVGLGVNPTITMELENTEAMKSLVRAGLGASIIPLFALQGRGHDPKIRPMRVRNARLERPMAIVRLDADVLPKAISELQHLIATGLVKRTPDSYTHRRNRS
jgi:DNA-binding transcriptional LysR family regulator